MPRSFSGDQAGDRRAVAKALRFFRTRKNRLFSFLNLRYGRTRQFLGLGKCYRRARSFKDCPKSGLALWRDLLTLFFSYQTLPENYGLCRLWEVPRKEWKYYFGSNFNFPQSTRLYKAVQPQEYRVLFDDKYLCVLLCRSLGIPAPNTRGVIDADEDYRARIKEWLGSSPSGNLIIKPLAGAMGSNIVLARKQEDGVIIDSGEKRLPLEEYILEGRAIVQDVLSQDGRMAEFCPSSVNTIRMVTMLTRQDEFLIVNASFRSGVGKAFVDNWSAGGVSVGVDCARGRLKKFAYDRRSQRYAVHPTSGLVFEDHPVPGWDRICRTAAFVQRAFSFYKFLGLDLALDAHGEPVLIEANARPDLAALEQKAGPLLKSEAALRAFGEYDLLVNRHQRKMYKELAASESSGRAR